jgi:mono/diheme cytochrome c family protein
MRFPRIILASALAGFVAGAAAAQPLAIPSFTQAQAARGEKSYMDNCAGCHGDRLDNGAGDGAPALAGPAFSQGWAAKPLNELFAYTSTNMPANAPASLSPSAYADIVAFLLGKNGVAPGTSELPADEARLKGMSGPK